MIDHQRRETMLGELLETMRRHHRRRRVRRGLGAAAVTALVAAGGAWIVRAPQPAETVRLAEAAAPRVVVVSGSHRTGVVRVIDDDGLVERLAEIDRPAGVIRSEGRIWLTSAVADADLETETAPAPSL
jgi:hypothetical protein